MQDRYVDLLYNDEHPLFENVIGAMCHYWNCKVLVLHVSVKLFILGVDVKWIYYVILLSKKFIENI